MIREADLESGKISGDVKSLSFLEKDIPKRIVEKRSKLRNAWKTQTRLERYLYFFYRDTEGEDPAITKASRKRSHEAQSYKFEVT